MNNYIALNGWIYCGFGGEKKPREFIDWAAAQGLDGVELTVGDCLAVDTTEDEAKALAAYAKEKGVGLRSLATGAGWGKWLCADDPAERAEAVASRLRDRCRVGCLRPTIRALAFKEIMISPAEAMRVHVPLAGGNGLVGCAAHQPI